MCLEEVREGRGDEERVYRRCVKSEGMKISFHIGRRNQLP